MVEINTPMQFRLTVLACFVVGTAFTVSAQSPVWWTERQVLTNDTSSDDFAVLNIGQLKNTAARAADEFRYRLPQGAGPEVSALIASWEPWLQGTDRDDFAVANIGQLKAVTQPFYQQLMDAGVVTSLPWADNDPARDDFAAANIGQLKAVFAFDLDADSDGDWMRDVDEKRAGTNPLVADAHLDDDSDGYSNWQEMLADTPAQSTLATGWQRAWSPVVWNPVSQATTAVESGLGSTLSALGSESGGASQEVLLRAGGFRFLVTDSASFRAGFATSSLVLTSPGWAVAADVDGANQLRVVVNDVVGDVVARIRSGDVLTLSRDEGQFRIWLNRVQIHSMTASNAPQRLVPNAHLRSQNMALLRCQSYGLELDEDGDGIADAWELEWIASRPSSSTITTILAFTPTADFDGDGVSNLLEFLYGLNPWSSDSDGDGTPDGVNVFAVDADGDGIPAHIETAWGLSDSDPSDAWQDLDGDGLSNWVEYTNLLANPAYVHDHPDDLIDTDGDGMTDVYEIHYGLNPLSFLDATHDNDGDGVMNFEEAAFALDPFDSQTRRDGPSDFAVAVLPFLAEEASSHRKLYGDWDQDGVPDWREHLANQMARARALDLDQPPPDVLLDLRTSDVMTDLDGDGILTMTELANGTNPLLVDTDGDGLSDLLDPDPGTIEAGYSAYLTVFWAEAQRSFIHQHLAKKGLMLLSMNSRGPHIKLEDWGDGWFRPQIPVPPYTSPDQPAFAGYFQAGPRDAVSWFLTEVNKAMAGYTPAVGTFWKSEMLQGASESHYFISSDYVETSRSDLRLFHIHPVHANLPQAQVGLWSVAMQMDPNVGPSPFQNPTAVAGQWSGMIAAGRSIAQATAIPAAVTVKDGPETLTTSRLQLSNSLLVWEEVPPLVVMIPGQGNLTEGFPGLHPGNAALYSAPLTTREGPSTNPTPPTVTVTTKGAGQVRLWAIEHKGNPTMENRVALPISNSLLTTDLLPLFVGLDLRAVTFWIEPLQPGPVTVTYLAKARHNSAQITKSFPINVALVPIDIEEVVSDQIAGNDANKLPTPYFGGQSNNPMLMATRSGSDARLMIKMNVAAAQAASIRVGVRVVNHAAILNSAPSVAPPAMTPLSFTALAGAQMYEIVAGLDANGNSALDPEEATIVFQKTPKTNVPGHKDGPNYIGALWWKADKIIIVTQSDFDAAQTKTDDYAEGWLVSHYPAAAGFLKAFARGATAVPGVSAASTTWGHVLDASTIPSADGLSYALGGRWTTPANQTTTLRFEFPAGSDLSNKVADSVGIDMMVARLLHKHKAMIAASATSAVSIVTLNSLTDSSISFRDTDKNKKVHVALGQCKFEGGLQVKVQTGSGLALEISEVNCWGSLLDLYDWDYHSPKPSFAGVVMGDPAEAAKVQAGYATLAPSTSWPDAGRVFFTKVDFGTGWIPYMITIP
jgi:hypothetical protein